MGGVRFTDGTTDGGQNSLLYLDSVYPFFCYYCVKMANHPIEWFSGRLIAVSFWFYRDKVDAQAFKMQ